jgi:putative membrane protein
VWAKFFPWRGVIAVGVFALATLWLGYEGRLGFYIHPRYNLFTTVMAGIGIALLAVAVFTHKPQGHDHDHDHPRRPRRYRATDIASVGITTAVLLTVIVLPPTTLSSATAANRSTNEVGVVTPSDSIDADGSAELFLSLTVRDWAGLLMQNQSPSFYRGKPVDTIGIVTSSELSEDVFNLTRFVVTCCAVDAQPVSIPVYYPGWKQSFPVDSWVRVGGGFSPSPIGVGSSGLVLVPVEIENQEVPREPYLF